MNGIVLALKCLVGVAGGLALLLGLGLALVPRATFNGSAWFGLHGPLVRLVRWFDERRFIERYVYRHHRWFGAVIAFGAISASVLLLRHAVPEALPAGVSELILLGAVRFLWLANTLFILVGLVIFLRPSLLKALEQWSNRWVAIDSPGRFDALLHAAPRIAGTVLAMTGIYLLSLMLIG